MPATRKNNNKNTNIWRLNNMLLNKQQITEEIKKEIKICIETNEKVFFRELEQLWYPVTLLVRTQTSTDTMENSVEIP